MIKTKTGKQEALERLRAILKPGDTVYTVLRHVSQSGMMRHIDFYVIGDNKPLYLSYLVAEVLGYKRAENGALKVSGCGMDMGFNVVYQLGRTIWPNGTDKPHGTRNGEPDSEGGYALKQSWL